jgi:rhamnosyltransferase
MSSTINILLSSYNGELYIQELLNSIINQTYKNWKLFIRDDGSSDSTINNIGKNYSDYPEKIKFANDNLENIKLAGSFMYLLSITNGDYFMFRDQDDVWFSQKQKKNMIK